MTLFDNIDHKCRPPFYKGFGLALSECKQRLSSREHHAMQIKGLTKIILLFSYYSAV